jgi:hypothetical protein
MAHQYVSTSWINTVTRRHVTHVENRPALNPRFNLPPYKPPQSPPIPTPIPPRNTGLCVIALTVDSAK